MVIILKIIELINNPVLSILLLHFIRNSFSIIKCISSCLDNYSNFFEEANFFALWCGDLLVKNNENFNIL